MFIPGTSTITIYPSTAAEANDVVLKVNQMLTDGVLPGQIAIIYSGVKPGKCFMKNAAFRRLPLQLDATYDLLLDPFTKNLFHLLSYLSMESHHPGHNDELLFELLSFDMFGIPAVELTKLVLTAGARKRMGPQNSLRQNLRQQANTPPKDLFDPGLHPALKKASFMLERLISMTGETPVPALFNRLIDDEIIDSYIDRTPEPRLRELVFVLAKLIGDAASREAGLNARQFVEAISLMKKENCPLHPSTNHDCAPGVHFLHLEQAPGLAVDHVFVAGLTNELLRQRANPPEVALVQPGSGKVLEQNGKAPGEEQLIGLYQAFATSKNLYLSFSSDCAPGYVISPAPQLASILNLRQVKVEELITIGDPEETTRLQLPKVSLPFSENEDLLKNSVRRFIMSASALNTWLDCPRSFYYKYILRVPSAGNEATAFGSAVHHALEQCFRHMQEGRQDKFPGCELLVNEFNNYMLLHRAKFSTEAFKKRMAYGTEILKNYHAQYHNEWKKIVSVELNISGVVVNGVPLKGKIDKLEFDGRNVNVVDYKSGDFEKALPKLQPPTEENPNGGDYWRQAVFYKILVDNYGRKDWNVISSEIDFIEPGKNLRFHKHQFALSSADVETVKQQFTHAWSKILEGVFDTGCGRDHCKWCNLSQDM